ncbi:MULTISPECIES: glycerol-3-phosphate 1-O-acyltransferase PlsB [Ferrimonas]|uniref:glycerol-3-phosphate 1-O-acyltransferase PlsB n=1 Tax=Ferrimonas TaxID=44011 RepID=UPI0003FC5D49|nr:MULTISPECIES: glycerol-3-phosphate 1-O-acyltransferase PlsB [Ferrimonas]USD39634.1 glycerol-3-phosphate 1-O-acyltransferase PlsB [Ferrimonas sp. SCSIO 43195]
MKGARWLQKPVVNSRLVPEDPIAELDIDTDRPLVYVMSHESHSDLLALHEACLNANLPSPLKPLQIKGQSVSRVVWLNGATPLFGKAKKADFLARFEKLLSLHQQHDDLDVQVVPVSLMWGRDPGKEESVSATLLNKEQPTWLRKFFILMMLGRDTFIRFSRPVSLRYMADKHGTDDSIAQKLARVARVHFGRQRTVATGPRLPDRDALFRSLLASKGLDEAIREEAKSKNISEEKARERALEYLEEIAADYSSNLIRIGERLLSWIWNKIYNGINVRGAEQVRQLSQDGHEIVFVPCHRSHMDYLLLSYIIYQQGMVPPHIAAGVNLNFWPAGPIFRHGGAFFIRRSFKGNKLYAEVFREYLHQLFARGYSIEYFCEGGRSRTGRLLPPKTGMIAMTIQTVLRGIERPVTLVPIYLGYDHVMEVATYHKELKGKKKEKEGMLQVLSAIKKLRNYGEGYVNFGQPITVHQFLNDKVPNWRQDTQADPDQRQPWLTPVVNELAGQLMCNINDAAAVSAVTLTATTLLATPQHAMARATLEKQLDFYLKLLQAVPYTPYTTLTDGDGKSILKTVLDLEKFQLSQDELGEIVSIADNQAITMTYYRNNILHLMILPSLIASLALKSDHLSRNQLIDQASELYPLLQAELFMGLDGELEEYLQAVINELINNGHLEEHGDHLRVVESHRNALMQLGAISQETLQRYAILLSRLQAEPQIERGALEKESTKLAERLCKLHGTSAPEFFDKKVFNTLTLRLKEMGCIGDKPDTDKIKALAQLVLKQLPVSMRASISQVG